MEACRLPKWPHEVLGLDLQPIEARRLLFSFLEGERSFLALELIEARARSG